MARNGKPQRKPANVRVVINGMVNIAKEPTNAQATEFGIPLTNNAYAVVAITGVDTHAYLSQNAKTDNFGILDS